jgi:HlyD family secretion protein
VIAQLDRSKLSDAVARSRANLTAARAQVMQADATITETRAVLERQREVARLSGGKVPSKSELDSAEANALRAEANAASARAAVVQAQANLESDLTNLGKATLRSPINGVVLTRKVEPGQTVAASFQVAVLFKIAEDLTKMELKVSIDEADVGHVKEGQGATFSVDAWPDRKYTAVVTRVGYGSEEKDGVISYPAVLQVRNDDLSLRPGMTGTADITTLTHENALLVPAAALRFSPPATAGTATAQRGGAMSFFMPRPPRAAAKKGGAGGKGPPRVYLLQGGQPVPVGVSPVATNGQLTEIAPGPLAAGTEVIVDAVSLTP